MLITRKHAAFGRIFVTATVNQFAEPIQPAAFVKINRSGHPILVYSGIDAGRAICQLVLAGRLVNEHRRLVGDVAGARKLRRLRRPYQAIGERNGASYIIPFGIGRVSGRIGRQNTVFKI